MSQDLINNSLICPNCQHTNDADALFCSHCSQKRNLGVLSVWEMSKEFVANFLDYDSKTFTTLRGVFLPGYLTNEYLKQRRVSYLSPIRLFIFLMFAFFALLSFQGFDQFKFNSGKDSAAVSKNNSVQFFNLLEKNYPSLRYNMLIEKIDYELQQQIKKKKKRINLLKSANDKPSNKPEKLAETTQKINELDQQIALIKSSFSALQVLKNAVEFNEPETLNFTLYYDKVYQFKLTDVNSLTSQKIIEKYKVNGWFDKIFVRQMLKFNKDSKAFTHFIFKNLTWVVILEVLLMSLIFKLFYIRSKRKYVEYFIFHLHVRSWLFFMAILLLLIPFELNAWVDLAIVLSIIVYMFMALKRVYNQSYFITCIKFILLSLIDFVIILFSFMSVILISSLLF